MLSPGTLKILVAGRLPPAVTSVSTLWWSVGGYARPPLILCRFPSEVNVSYTSKEETKGSRSPVSTVTEGSRGYLVEKSNMESSFHWNILPASGEV